MHFNTNQVNFFRDDVAATPPHGPTWPQQSPAATHIALAPNPQYSGALAYPQPSSPSPSIFSCGPAMPIIHTTAAQPQSHQPVFIMMDSSNTTLTPNAYYTGQHAPVGFAIVNVDQRGEQQQQQQQQQQQTPCDQAIPRPLVTVVPMGNSAQELQIQSPFHQHQPQHAPQPQVQRPSHDVRQWGFAVVDQLHPLLPRVPLPPSVIAEETRGIALYNNNVLASSTRPCASQVCLLYAHTGCRAGKDCVSFHVDPVYLALSRAVSQPLCCALHNCFYSHEMIRSDCAPDIIHRAYSISLDTPQTLASGVGSASSPRVVDISLLHLSMTVGLETLPVRDGKAIISLRRHVCRLHLEGRCKWTKDCGHIHVCRDLLPMLEKREVLDFLDAIPREAPELITQRLRESADARRYVQSAAALPMVAQLLLHGRHNTLAALLTFRVACVRPQLARMQQLGLVLGEWDVTMHEVSPKLMLYLAP